MPATERISETSESSNDQRADASQRLYDDTSSKPGEFDAPVQTRESHGAETASLPSMEIVGAGQQTPAPVETNQTGAGAGAGVEGTGAGAGAGVEGTGTGAEGAGARAGAEATGAQPEAAVTTGEPAPNATGLESVVGASGTIESPASAVVAPESSMVNDIMSWAASVRGDVSTLMDNPGLVGRELWEGIRYEALNNPLGLAGSVALGAATAVLTGAAIGLVGTPAAIAAGVVGVGWLAYTGFQALRGLASGARTLSDPSSSPQDQDLARGQMRGYGAGMAHLAAGAFGAGAATGALMAMQRHGFSSIMPEQIVTRFDRFGAYEASAIPSWTQMIGPATGVNLISPIFPTINGLEAYYNQRNRAQFPNSSFLR